MKRTLEKIIITMTERDVLDAIDCYVRSHYEDLDASVFEITVAVTKGKYSAEVEVNSK